MYRLEDKLLFSIVGITPRFNDLNIILVNATDKFSFFFEGGFAPFTPLVATRSKRQ